MKSIIHPNTKKLIQVIWEEKNAFKFDRLLLIIIRGKNMAEEN